MILTMAAVATANPTYLAPKENVDFLSPDRANLVKVFLQQGQNRKSVMEVDTSTQVSNRQKLKFKPSTKTGQEIIIDLGTEAVVKEMRYKNGCRGQTPIEIDTEECTQDYSSVELYYRGKIEEVRYNPLTSARINLKDRMDEALYGQMNIAQFNEKGMKSVENKDVYSKIIKAEEDLQDFTRARFIKYDMKTPMAKDFAYDDSGTYRGGAKGFAKNKEEDLEYIDIVNIQVFGHCFCNGHASSCNIENGKFQCACEHGTTGPSCGKCLATHGAQKWQRNLNTMFSPDSDLRKINFAHTVSECELCNCNGRGLLCEWKDDFSATKAFSVGRSECLCFPGYSGDSCETCVGVGLDPKKNCGSCRDGFYNYDPELKSCTSCGCVLKNSHEGTHVCDKISGECPCQRMHLGDMNESRYMGRTCNQCYTNSNPKERNYYRVSTVNIAPEFGEVNCAPCPVWCNQAYDCTGSGLSHCEVCAPGWHRTKDDICVSECPQDTFPFQGPEHRQSHCLKCHEECKSGCTGSSERDCRDPKSLNPCVHYMLKEENITTCLPKCPLGFYGDSEYPGECKKCHRECDGVSGQLHTDRFSASGVCFGAGADQCYACKNKRHDKECVPECRSGFFPEKDSNECKQCHSNCRYNCSGPSNTDCATRQCAPGHFLMINSDFNTNEEGHRCLDECPVGSWVMKIGRMDFSKCMPCDKHCSSEGCRGKGPFMCFNNKCGDRYPSILIGDQRKCVENCSEPNVPEGAGRYYSACVTPGEGGRCTAYECRKCHFSCLSGCSGPHSWQCSDGCREYVDETSLTVAQNHSQCIRKCPKHSYISSPMAGGAEKGRCRDCHPSCDECYGPHKNQCLKCKELFEVGGDTCPIDLHKKTPTQVSADTICVECLNGPTCPVDHYKLPHPNYTHVGKAECSRCSQQCFYGCVGPTAKDCIILGNHDYSGIPYPSPCTFYWMNYKNSTIAECVSECPKKGYYGAIGERRCEKCHPQCNSCTGPGASECMFDCKNVFSEAKGECAEKCSSEEFREPNSNICKPCSSVCTHIQNMRGSPKCFGSGPENCYSCKYGIAKKISILNNDKYICQDHNGCSLDSRYTFPASVSRGGVDFPTGIMSVTVCDECHSHCDKRYGCTGPLRSDCHVCRGYRYLRDNKCYNIGDADFPSHTFSSSQKSSKNASLTHPVLEDCHPSCNSCSGRFNDQCKGLTGREKCAKGYYLNKKDGSCQKSCGPIKTYDGATFYRLQYRYANEETRECELCSPYCKSTCSGGASDCDTCVAGRYKNPSNGKCEKCYDLCELETCNGPYAVNCTEQKCKYGLTIRDIGSKLFPGGRCTHTCGDEYYEPLTEKCVKECDASMNRSAIEHDYIEIVKASSESQYIARKMCGCMKSMKVGNTDICLRECPSGYIVLAGQGNGNSFIGRGHNGRCVCHKKFQSGGSSMQCLDECPPHTNYVPFGDGEKTGECKCKFYMQNNPDTCLESCPPGYKEHKTGGCMCDKLLKLTSSNIDEDNNKHEEQCVNQCPKGFEAIDQWSEDLKRFDITLTCKCKFLNIIGNKKCVETCGVNQIPGSIDVFGTKMCECKEGFYHDKIENVCKKCHDECGAACTGGENFECSKIVGKTLCKNFHLVEGKINGKTLFNQCLKECPEGYQQAGNSKTCKCKLLHKGECREECPEGYKPEGNLCVCDKKHLGGCVNECPDDYIVNSKNTCVCSLDHYTKPDGSCGKCHEECVTNHPEDPRLAGCSGPGAHECKACEHHKMPSSNGDVCVNECPDDYIVNSKNTCVCSLDHYTKPDGSCGKCHEECDTKYTEDPRLAGCSGPGAHECKTCKNHKMPSSNGGICVDQCDIGFAPEGLTNYEKDCSSCHFECGDQGCSRPRISIANNQETFCSNCRLYSKYYPTGGKVTCVSECSASQSYVRRYADSTVAQCTEKCSDFEYFKSLWKGPGENDYYDIKGNICDCGSEENVVKSSCFQAVQAACHIDDGLPFCQACEDQFEIRERSGNGEYYLPSEWPDEDNDGPRKNCMDTILKYTRHSNGASIPGKQNNLVNLCVPNPYLSLKQKKCMNSYSITKEQQNYLDNIGAKKTDFISNKVPVTYQEAFDKMNSKGNSNNELEKSKAPKELLPLATRSDASAASSSEEDESATLGYVGIGIGSLAVVVIVIGIMHIQKQKAKKRDEFEKSMNASGFGRGGNVNMFNNTSYQDPSSQSIYSQVAFDPSTNGYADPGVFSQQQSYANSERSSYSQDDLFMSNNTMDQKAPAYDSQYQIGDEQMFQSHVGGTFDDEATGVATQL
eukprot:UC4_evm2s1187